MTKRGSIFLTLLLTAAVALGATPAHASEPAVDLDMYLQGESTAIAGRTAEFLLRVQAKQPPAELRSIRAALTLPAGVTYQSYRTGESGACTAAGAVVTCAVERTDEAQREFVWHVTVAFDKDIPLDQHLRLTAVASSDGTEATPRDNTDFRDTTVVHATDLGITLIPPAGPVTLGQPLKYTLVIRNHGPGAVGYFVVKEFFTTDVFESHHIDGAGDGYCWGDPGMVVCDVMTLLKPGAELRLEHVLPTKAAGTVHDPKRSISVRLEYAGDENPDNDALKVPFRLVPTPGAGSSTPSASPSTGGGQGGTSGGGLPITGPTTAPIVVLALLLLMAGSGAVLVSRRAHR